MDWGVEPLTTLADSEGNFKEIENPRFKSAWKQLCSAQKNLSRKKLGSKNRTKTREKVARQYLKLTHLRKNYLHQSSAKIMKESALIATEK